MSSGIPEDYTYPEYHNFCYIEELVTVPLTYFKSPEDIGGFFLGNNSRSTRTSETSPGNHPHS